MAKVNSEVLSTVQTWFSSMQQVAPAVRKLASKESQDLYEAFGRAGISQAEQLAGGESIQGLMEASGKTIDGLMSAMRQCPFGKQMPKLEG